MVPKSVIITASGKLLDLLDPSPDDIELSDIRQGLAAAQRYAGHAARPCSVLDHSVLVARLVSVQDPSKIRAAALHDAAEAYLGDISAPLRAFLSGYDEIEARLLKIIAEKFGVDCADFSCPLVRCADMGARLVERLFCLSPDQRRAWPLTEGEERKAYALAKNAKEALQLTPWLWNLQTIVTRTNNELESP